MPTMRITSNSAFNIVANNGPVNTALIAPLSTSGNTVSTASTNLIFGSNSTATSNISALAIYKGTPETFPSFTDRSTRASDLLISFILPTTPYQDIGLVGTAYRWLVGRKTTNTAATGSGTATWFLCYRILTGNNSLTNVGAMIGSVGTLGSGADLEIADTNIVSGSNYQCNGFYFNIPLNWSV